MPTPKTQQRWLRDDELAEELHISRGMIHKLRGQGLPSLSIGRSRRYDPDAVIEWLRSREAS